jgi:hypothetical protein
MLYSFVAAAVDATDALKPLLVLLLLVLLLILQSLVLLTSLLSSSGQQLLSKYIATVMCYLSCYFALVVDSM